MRHFTSWSTSSSTFVADETMGLTDPAFVRIMEALVITMGANPEKMSTSEEVTLDNFIRWFEENRSRSLYLAVPKDQRSVRDELFVVSPVFSYHNLTGGHSLSVIWSDTKGKVSYLLRA